MLKQLTDSMFLHSRYVNRKGPLIIYDVSEGIDKGFRNLPGVDLATVDNLSLLDLAPGGHLGRFCIWTLGAFDKLDSLFGTYEEGAKLKNGFNLPRAFMSNADLARIINSDEIQSIVKPAITTPTILPPKSNPLRNVKAKVALNPYHAQVQAREVKKLEVAKVSKAAATKKRAEVSKKFKARRKEFYKSASKEGELAF